MSVPIRLRLAAAALVALCAIPVHADKKTVCTITVNSPDEKQIFGRNLPTDEFQFVELVERGRPDWLASACRAGIRCDVLLISGHFDGGDEFYSDRPDVREYLPVDEMERASCSDSCSGLFSELKEVYLFGCNTLNADAQNVASAEIARSLVRSGYSTADAERLVRGLNERHSDSNRDRMRQIFAHVPVIYGFSSKAPLGRTAAPLLDRYFRPGANAESVASVGSGRVNPKLLGLFAPSSMTATTGVTDTEPQADNRRDVCRIMDDGSSTTRKVAFIHDVLHREMAEVRMFLGQIEKYVSTLGDRNVPAVSGALAQIAADQATRDRYLAFVRDADEPAVRVRMLKLAQSLGWLSTDDLRVELVSLMRDRLMQRALGPADVDLFCSLNRNGELNGNLHLLSVREDNVGNAAVRACLGSEKGRVRVLQALTSTSNDDVEIAQIYLHHQPIADPSELRGITAEIARMKTGDAQVRALGALARYEISDRDSLDALTRLFPLTRSVAVQRAIAGVLLHADYRALEKPELSRALRQHRLKSPGGEDLIDVLIRRLES